MACKLTHSVIVVSDLSHLLFSSMVYSFSLFFCGGNSNGKILNKAGSMPAPARHLISKNIPQVQHRLSCGISPFSSKHQESLALPFNIFPHPVLDGLWWPSRFNIWLVWKALADEDDEVISRGQGTHPVVSKPSRSLVWWLEQKGQELAYQFSELL